jgi:hypothetical protein
MIAARSLYQNESDVQPLLTERQMDPQNPSPLACSTPDRLAAIEARLEQIAASLEYVLDCKCYYLT